MPTVPNYGDPSVAPTAPSGERFSQPGPAGGTIVAQQGEQLGAAVEGAGNTGAGIAADMQRTANEVRLAGARNAAIEAQQRLMYGMGPDDKDALVNQRGADALNRPSGQALPEEYRQKYQDVLAKISGSLGNPVQQREFQVQAQELLAAFHGVAEQHMANQFHAYQGSVWDGQIQLSHNGAVKAWNNPDQVAPYVALIKQGVYQKAHLLGLSGEQTQSEIDNAVSGVHKDIIETALANNNSTYALAYFDKNKDALNANDTLAVQGQVNHAVDARTALDAVGNTRAAFATQFAPSEMDRVLNIVGGLETNNRDTNADGTPMVSSKGAKYRLQVTPTTAGNPGFGIQPAKADTADEYNRVGAQYIGALAKKYQGLDQVLAAYNAGPGALDSAMDKAKAAGKPGAWLSYMPKETQDYVTKGTSQYNTGGGAPVLPTKTEFVDHALSQLGDTPRIEAVTATREQAEKQYDLLLQSRKEKSEQSLELAQRALVQNGGDFGALPPQLKSDLTRYDPTMWDKARDYAGAVSHPPVNNLAAYNAAVQYPEELARMTDTEFSQFLKTNFTDRTGESIARIRSGILNGTDKADQSAGNLNSKAFNTIVNNRLNSIGINPTPDRKDNDAQARVGAIKKYLADGVYAQQQQLGRKMTAEEVSDYTDKQFAKSVELPGLLWGSKNKPLLSMTISDVPSATATAIRNAYAAHGIKTPTDDMLIRAYWAGQNGK